MVKLPGMIDWQSIDHFPKQVYKLQLRTSPTMESGKGEEFIPGSTWSNVHSLASLVCVF
jgi:hypothetical protein